MHVTSLRSSRTAALAAVARKALEWVPSAGVRATPA
jgi:hypothetical protein